MTVTLLYCAALSRYCWICKIGTDRSLSNKLRFPPLYPCRTENMESENRMHSLTLRRVPGASHIKLLRSMLSFFPIGRAFQLALYNIL